MLNVFGAVGFEIKDGPWMIDGFGKFGQVIEVEFHTSLDNGEKSSIVWLRYLNGRTDFWSGHELREPTKFEQETWELIGRNQKLLDR